MKKSWKLGILLIVLVLLGGIYVFMKNSDNSNNKQTDTKTESSKTIEILKLDKNKLTKLEFKAQKEGVNLEKKDGKWIFSDRSYNIDETTINSLIDTISNLNSSKLVEENASDLEQYGLKNPPITITIFLDSGEKKVVCIGNTSVAGSYYLTLQDNNKVFSVNAADIESINVFSLKNANR